MAQCECGKRGKLNTIHDWFASSSSSKCAIFVSYIMLCSSGGGGDRGNTPCWWGTKELGMRWPVDDTKSFEFLAKIPDDFLSKARGALNIKYPVQPATIPRRHHHHLRVSLGGWDGWKPTSSIIYNLKSSIFRRRC